MSMSGITPTELRTVLRHWSETQGYVQDFPALPGDPGARHNVLRVHPAQRLMFLGTCVADVSLRAAPLDELRRISDQLGAFVELLRVYRGGVFAVATDDPSAAGDWIGTLNLLGAAAGLAAPLARPAFASTTHEGASTAIVYWASPAAR